jgi:hypothetical protein
MGATNARLKADQVEDYRQMLEAISDMVLTAVRRRDVSGVRRWCSSLAHVGHVLLDHRAASKGPKAA